MDFNSPDSVQSEQDQLVVVRAFRDLPEALLAKGCLESAGIRCLLADDNMVRLDWFISNFIGGIKLKVSSSDFEDATEILDAPIPAAFDLSAATAFAQPHCPSCDSLDIAFQESLGSAYVSSYLGLPLPLRRRAWRCSSCQKEWQEVEDGETLAL